MIELRALAQTGSTLTVSERRLLVQASTVLAQRCGGLTLRGLDTLVQQAIRRAAQTGQSATVKGRSTVISVLPTELGTEVWVSFELPKSAEPRCAMPPTG
ncbi:MAG: hypothetical protein JWQ08_468 [Deinococcus sp.]|nr:hypothetical protein [Deinococcus sp.]